MEPAGFEPATFPVSPGRTDKLFQIAPVLLPLDLDFSSNGFWTSCVLLEIDYLPRTSILECSRIVGVMVGESLLEILRLANIVAPCYLTLENVDVEHGESFGGAGGVRTRDLLDAIEARSQLRYGPTEDKTECLPL